MPPTPPDEWMSYISQNINISSILTKQQQLLLSQQQQQQPVSTNQTQQPLTSSTQQPYDGNNRVLGLCYQDFRLESHSNLN
jgi:hypothetical protein